MFAMLLIAAAVSAPQIAPAAASQARSAASVQATATIRIVEGTSASAKNWNAPDGRNSASDGQKHEVIFREADGRTMILRLFEHE
jgi:hypothetical protein